MSGGRFEYMDSQLKSEFLTALQPAFARLSDMELRPNQIVAHNTDLENAMNEALSVKWGQLRGLQVVSIALGSVTLPPEDAEMIKQLQRTAVLQNPMMAGATLHLGEDAEFIIKKLLSTTLFKYPLVLVEYIMQL